MKIKKEINGRRGAAGCFGNGSYKVILNEQGKGFDDPGKQAMVQVKPANRQVQGIRLMRNPEFALRVCAVR